jgi:hypothetical protein
MKILIVTEYLTASAIQAGGGRFLRAEPPGEGRSKCGLVFCDDDGKASELLAKHQQGTLRIPTRDFASAIGSMKNAIFTARG